MEIEIVTTKKKLTKSIIDQIPWLSITNYVGLTTCICLGHFKVKNDNIGLIKYNNIYYKLDLDWLEGRDNYLIQKRPNFCSTRLEFLTEEEKLTHFFNYNINKQKCLSTQIYY